MRETCPPGVSGGTATHKYMNDAKLKCGPRRNRVWELNGLSVENHTAFMREALKEARIGFEEGGIPIGSVLAIGGRIVGRGHNRRVQRKSAILHAEMDCLENAGRLRYDEYKRSVLYSTLSPCDMCTGAVLLYKIPTVVIGENETFSGPEEYSRRRGVQIINLDMNECKDLMRDFIEKRPELWKEDIGR